MNTKPVKTHDGVRSLSQGIEALEQWYYFSVARVGESNVGIDWDISLSPASMKEAAEEVNSGNARYVHNGLVDMPGSPGSVWQGYIRAAKGSRLAETEIAMTYCGTFSAHR